MDIIQRNFLRLLRAGAFAETEAIEPMSGWKWKRLYQLSQIHGVCPWISDGIQRLEGDFFLQLAPDLRQQFYSDTTTREEPVEPQQLTNPLLNRKLQQLADEAGPDDATFSMLLRLIAIARYILVQGISLRQLIALGTQLRTRHDTILYDVLRQWAAKLDMQRILQLEGALLVELFHFSPEEIPFTDVITARDTQKVIADMFTMTGKNAAEWYFTQGESIFVSTNDSHALLWHVSHSARYMHYFPTEAVTSFMANFAHSLSHIEE